MAQPNNHWQREIVDANGAGLGTQASPMIGGVAYTEITPNLQASANAVAVVTGSNVDCRAKRSLSYIVSAAAQTITYWVYGANRADFADEVIVSGPTDVTAGNLSTYAVAQAPYGYYRVKIQDKVAGTHGNVGVYGIAKG